MQISKKQQLDFGRAVSIFKGLRRCVQAAKQQARLDPQIEWNCDYYSGNKVQLNGDIQVTLTQRVDIGFFVFGSFPIELKARASGKSEVYYK